MLRGARKTILNDQPFIFYEETFHKNDAQRTDGRLLWDVLGTNSTYACQCASDCFCRPRMPTDLVASLNGTTSPQSRACHSGMRFQQSSMRAGATPTVSPFAANASACEQTLESCPIGAGVGPRNKTTAADVSCTASGELFFMGNSVDRHYAFALHNLLHGRVGCTSIGQQKRAHARVFLARAHADCARTLARTSPSCGRITWDSKRRTTMLIATRALRHPRRLSVA